MIIKLTDYTHSNVIINTEYIQFCIENEDGFSIFFNNGSPIKINRPMAEFESIIKAHGLRIINIL